MFYMFMDHMFYIPMNMFNIMISMINYTIYVIIIILIYGIKMIWKLRKYLTMNPWLYLLSTTCAHSCYFPPL